MHEAVARVDRRAAAAVRMAVLCIVLGSSFGCGAQRGTLGSPLRDQEDGRIRIEIQNRGFDDITVHALFDARRIRLGIVTGKRTDSFMLPLDNSVLLQLEIDVLAGPSCTTRDMWVDPGEIVVMEILSVDLLGGLRWCGR